MGKPRSFLFQAVFCVVFDSAWSTSTCCILSRVYNSNMSI